jgi:hypothetical protein
VVVLCLFVLPNSHTHTCIIVCSHFSQFILSFETISSNGHVSSSLCIHIDSARLFVSRLFVFANEFVFVKTVDRGVWYVWGGGIRFLVGFALVWVCGCGCGCRWVNRSPIRMVQDPLAMFSAAKTPALLSPAPSPKTAVSSSSSNSGVAVSPARSEISDDYDESVSDIFVESDDPDVY